MASTMTLDNQNYDRLEEAKRFDDSKLGVKGLIDSGVTSIPRLFIHPSHTLNDLKPTSRDLIPAIDLSGVDSDRRPAIVEQLSRASRELGFFQIVNHGIPKDVLDRIISGMKAFHEQPTEIKKQWYSRKVETGVSYLSNIDLFRAKAASWRDTLQVKLGPELAPSENIPEICRKEVVEWNEQATKVAEMLMELLSEGLGLASGKLKEMSCLDAKLMAAHYYPPCPQPDLTFGITSHTDPGVVTVVLQDHIGGLQVKHGDDWVEAKPIPGALVINIGDILQILSNDEYTSVNHRVVANPSSEARQSVAIFFNPGKRDCMYGPIPELVSPEKPTRYRQFSLVDYMGRFFSKELDGKTLTNYYRDHIKVLQIKHRDRWLDVEPVPGALTINIGDIFQMLSNDEYKSVEHRVLANPFQNPRVSVVTFFNPGKKDSLHGPIPEVISPETPALYRQFTLADYQKRWMSKQVDGKTLLDYYKV